MAEIEIKGRRVPLAFTLSTMEECEKAFGSIEEMMRRLNSKSRSGAVLDALTAMANTAQVVSGKEPIFSREWFGRYLKPADLPAMAKAIAATLEESTKMETNGGELDDTEHDPVLEALERKKAEA